MTPYGRIDDLLQRAVDGTLSDADRDVLRDWLAQDPAAAERLRELRRLDVLLREMPEAEPPAELTIEALLAARRNTEETGTAAFRMAARRGAAWEGVIMKTWKIAAIAAVAILAVGAALYFEGFRPQDATEEAAGTIGAVKKYRAEQIGEQDVVLGGISSPDVIPFADFIAEGATLGSLSRDIASFAAKIETMGAKDALAAAKRIQAELEARGQQVEAKTLGALTLQAKDLAGALEANSALEAKTGESLRATTLGIASGLESKKLDVQAARTQLEAAATEYLAASRLEAKTLDAKALESARATLDSMKNQLEARKLNIESATRDMAAMTTALEARDQVFQAKTLDARNAYIAAAAGHQADLFAARDQLSAVVQELESGSALEAKRLQGMRTQFEDLGAKLQAKGQALEAKGLLEMQRQLESATLDAKNLLGIQNSLDLAAKTALEAKSADAGAKAASDLLGKASASLEAKRLRAATHLAAVAASDLGSASRLMQAKDVQLGAESALAMKDHLGRVSAALEGRVANVDGALAQRMQSELSAATTALAAKQLQAKSQPE